MENTDGSYSDGFAIDYLGLHTDYKGEDMLDLAISMLSELSLRLHNVTFSRNIFPFFFFLFCGECLIIFFAVLFYQRNG